MSSMLTMFLIIGIAFLLSVGYLVFSLIRAGVRARGPRVVVCPETVTPESVEVGGFRTAWTTVAGDPQLKLTSCSRWPEHADCGQKCMTQIESAEDGCLVRIRVSRWYESSLCGLCGKPVGDTRFNRRSSVVAPDGRIRPWDELTVPDLPDVLATYRPICPVCTQNPPRRTPASGRRAGSAA